MYKINHANIKEWAKNYDGPLFDGILCDPPYELGFMGKSWDSSGIAFDKDMWADLLRILKPGGHLLAFSGSRTYHRMAVAIEDAGFEIRDMIEWVYGSGFPKSLNIGKAVDKIQGNEREVTGIKEQPLMTNHYGKGLHNERPIKELEETKGTSPYEGYGTALKPAHEPCVLARKPIEGTVANNVLKHGTGGLAIDNCRIKPANATDEPSNPLLSAQRTVFSDKPELAPSSLDEIFSYSLDTLHDYFEHISSEQRAYNIVCTTPLHDVAFLKNTQNKQLLGVPCDYGQLVERVRQYENQGYEAQDFLSDYPTLHRLCDVYARQAKVPDQDVAPLLADVLAYIRSVQQESLHSPDYNSQYLLLVLVVFAYDLLRSILPYDYTTSSTQSTGRFPSNLILDGSDEVEAVFPQTGKSSGGRIGNKGSMINTMGNAYEKGDPGFGDSGSASRYFKVCKDLVSDTPASCSEKTYDVVGVNGTKDQPGLFYTAKASKSERNAGLEGFEEVIRNDGRDESLASGNMPQNRSNNPKANHHPTVKPLSLTKYLATLIKPPTGGRLLVPFSGSGSEMIGGLQAGWEFVEGVELTEEYIPIAEARIKYWQNIPQTSSKPKPSAKKAEDIQTEQQELLQI